MGAAKSVENAALYSARKEKSKLLQKNRDKLLGRPNRIEQSGESIATPRDALPGDPQRLRSVSIAQPSPFANPHVDDIPAQRETLFRPGVSRQLNSNAIAEEQNASF